MAAERYLSKEAGDLTLFHYDGCFYCQLVRDALAELGLVIRERNILADPSAAEELIDARGRRTVPVLRIGEGEDVRYLGESRDIVRYLYDRFGEGEQEPSASQTGALDFWLRITMWALLAAGGLYADGRLVLWSAAMTVAGGRSLYAGVRSGAIAHYLIGSVFIVAAIATAVEGLGWGSFEWWWLSLLLLPILALPAMRRRRQNSVES